ncbi:MAG TPA: SMI1/KNR4 family protein [Polyangiaceae bacterium]|jgi:hypothetical protein
MRRFERHDAGIPDRPGLNPFTKQPLILKGRPPRTVRCEVAVDSASVITQWTWFEAGARTAGPHTNKRAFSAPEAAAQHAAELADDLLADGLREEGGSPAPPLAPDEGAQPTPPQEPTGSGEVVAAILQRCRARNWFGSDMQRRFATRESLEHRQFRHAPATAAEIGETERQLGFPLPPLLRDLYTQVANGGFGPGYGLLGAVGGAPDDWAANIAEAYRQDRDLSPRLEESDAEPGSDAWFEPYYDEWPGRVLRLVHWGCAIWSCLDVRRDRVFRFEHLHGTRTREAMLVEATSLKSWLEGWLQGSAAFRG